MARWRGLDGPPASYLVDGSWPDGTVHGPTEVHVAQALGQRLHHAVGDRGLRDLARAARLNHASLRAVLRGEAWPDMITVARLEAALEADLWPGRHVRQTGPEGGD